MYLAGAFAAGPIRSLAVASDALSRPALRAASPCNVVNLEATYGIREDTDCPTHSDHEGKKAQHHFDSSPQG